MPKGDKTPKKIGSFLLQAKLGEGTFATVYLGLHLQTNEQVAIKVLNKHQIFEQITKTRIEREIKILKLLRHPNIIHLYSVIQTTDNIFLVMEYANGNELFEYINHKRRLSELEACKFYQQIISGIEYLSKLQVTHRDLKPENLLLDAKKQNIKICDFGLSNTYSLKNMYLHSACGSPCYAAPEMIQGKKYIGSRIDIWSSGIILYAMLCGYLPFEESSNDLLYRKIIKGELMFPKHLSDLAKDFLLKVLNVFPERRYTVEQIKKHPWFNLLNKMNRLYEGLVVSKVIIPIDEDIVQQMESIGFKKEDTRLQIAENKHNNLTTTYYLLLNKKIRNGLSSVSDLRSKEFEEYLTKEEHYVVSKVKGNENRNAKAHYNDACNYLSTHGSTKRIKCNLVYTINERANTTESTVVSSMKMLINTSNKRKQPTSLSKAKNKQNYSKEHYITFSNVSKDKSPVKVKTKQKSTSVHKSKGKGVNNNNNSNTRKCNKMKLIKELIPSNQCNKIPKKIHKETTTTSNKVSITVSSTTSHNNNNKHMKGLQSSKVLYHKANFNLKSIRYTNPKSIITTTTTNTNTTTTHDKSISHDIDTNIQALFTNKLNKRLFDKTIKTNITTTIINNTSTSNKKPSPSSKHNSFKQFTTSISPLRPSSKLTSKHFKPKLNAPNIFANKLSLSRKELYNIIFNSKPQHHHQRNNNNTKSKQRSSLNKRSQHVDHRHHHQFRRRKLFNTSINYEMSNVNSFNASMSCSLNTSISRHHKTNYSNTISNVSILIDDTSKNKKEIDKAYVLKKSKNKRFITINEVPKRNKTPNIRKRTNMTMDVVMDMNNMMITKKQ